MTRTPVTGVPTSPPPPVAQPLNGNAYAGFARSVSQQFVSLGLQAEIDHALNEQAQRVLATQRWLGNQGLLLEFRIAQSIDDPLYPRHYRLVGVTDHGIASTAAVALTNTMQQEDKLAASVPSGYREIREHSFFLWFKADGEPTKVAWPSNARLVQEALRIDADKVLRNQVLEQQVVDRWRALEQAAVTGLPEAQGRAAFERSVRAAAAAYEELRAINNKLAEAQEAARQSAAAMQWLQTLGTALDLATQVAEINQRLRKDAVPSPVLVESSTDLFDYVHTVNIRRSNGVITVEQQKSTAVRNHEGILQELRTQATQWGVPESALPLPRR